MQLPKSIKIGLFDYKVRYNKTLKDCHGDCNPDTKIIRISKEYSKLSQAETLFHEILHAIYYESRLNEHHKPEVEEQIVSTLAPYLLSAIIDNPELMGILKDFTK